MTVQAILQRITAGEQRAFAELIELYQRSLFGFLGRFSSTATHFSQRVTQRIQPLQRNTSLPDGPAFAPARPKPNFLSRLRWLATGAGLVGGGLLGLSQPGSFVFGLWIASSAI